MFCMRSTKIKVRHLGTLSTELAIFVKTLTCLISGFEILAFPCNQFGWQEPGTNDEIQETVCTRFKAEFPVFDKVVSSNH